MSAGVLHDRRNTADFFFYLVTILVMNIKHILAGVSMFAVIFSVFAFAPQSKACGGSLMPGNQSFGNGMNMMPNNGNFGQINGMNGFPGNSQMMSYGQDDNDSSSCSDSPSYMGQDNLQNDMNDSSDLEQSSDCPVCGQATGTPSQNEFVPACQKLQSVTDKLFSNQ